MGSIVGKEHSRNLALYGNVGKVKGFTCILGSGKSGLGVVDELLCACNIERIVNVTYTVLIGVFFSMFENEIFAFKGFGSPGCGCGAANFVFGNE